MLYMYVYPYIGAFQISQLIKNPTAMQETPGRFLGQEDPLEKGKATTPVFVDFPCGSAGKESACNVGGLGSISGLGRSPGKGKGYPLQYSGLEDSMDCTVHVVAKSQTRLSNFHFYFTFIYIHIYVYIVEVIYIDYIYRESQLYYFFILFFSSSVCMGVKFAIQKGVSLVKGLI